MLSCVVVEHIGPGLSDRWQFLHSTGESAIADTESSADHVIEEGGKGLNHHIEGSGDQECPVTEPTVLADPGEASWIGAKQQLFGEQLPRVSPQLFD